MGLQFSSDMMHGYATGDWGGAFANTGLSVISNYITPFGTGNLAGAVGGAGSWLGGEMISAGGIKQAGCN